MADLAGEADKGALKLDFDHCLFLQFRGSTITSDAGLLPYHELDETIGPTPMRGYHSLTQAPARTVAIGRGCKRRREAMPRPDDMPKLPGAGC
jgi:hypothetical protein